MRTPAIAEGVPHPRAEFPALGLRHHVRPPRPDRFQPNRLLEVTPRFLARLVRGLRRSGLEFITLDELPRNPTGKVLKRNLSL